MSDYSRLWEQVRHTVWAKSSRRGEDRVASARHASGEDARSGNQRASHSVGRGRREDQASGSMNGAGEE